MNKIETSKEANVNYLAKIVKLSAPKKHPNADKLQIFTVDFLNIITGLDATEGDIYVYFPVESCISAEFLSYTNSFRETSLNKNRDESGFFEENGRVRAVKLRGERSFGYIVPVEKVEEWAGVSGLSELVGESFDTVNGSVLIKKYMLPVKGVAYTNKQGKKAHISRLVEGQFHFHVDTENFRHCANEIKPDDQISITYKIHGTSFIVANVLTKVKLGPVLSILKKLGMPIQDTKYDLLYASRRVVKNEAETKNKKGFYEEDIWGTIKEEIGHLIPPGFTVYGECVGFLKNGKAIQAGYDYGCGPTEHKVFIYRITQTNAIGIVTELNTAQMIEFCAHTGLNYVELFYNGKAGDWKPTKGKKLNKSKHWNSNFVIELAKEYNDKDCHMCRKKVPEEGIVIKKESLYEFKAYKLKSPAFLEFETKQLDSGESDLESIN